MVLLVHPGTQHSYQLAKQLARHGKLSEFWTGFALPEDAWYTRAVQTLLPETFGDKLGNRIVRDVPAELLRTKPLIGLKAVRQIRHGRPSQQVFHAINGKFQTKIPASSLKRASAVIGFDTASWLLAENVTMRGKPFFLDRSISHPSSNEEALRNAGRQFPEWNVSFQSRLAEVLEAENREHSLATRIVAASSYSKRTLVSWGVEADKIVVNPYGVDLERFQPGNNGRADRPVRFLFVGTISARKGIPLLIEAWGSLGFHHCELWLAGPVSDSVRPLIPELPGLKVLGKYPHSKLPALFKQCDVFVFPSYCEGFGLVLLEALASGLPIITTDATAGPDLIQDGVEGFITPSGDIDRLCQAIRFFVDNPNKLSEMSRAARRCAEKFTWDAYGDRWNCLLEECI